MIDRSLSLCPQGQSSCKRKLRERPQASLRSRSSPASRPQYSDQAHMLRQGIQGGLVPQTLAAAAAAARCCCCPAAWTAVLSAEARQPGSWPGPRPNAGSAPPPPLRPPLAAASLRSISIGKGSNKYPTAAVAAAAQRCSVNTASQPCQAASSSSGGSGADAEEASCADGSPPRAALEAQLAEVEQRLTALYAQSDALQQQETELTEAEEQLLR